MCVTSRLVVNWLSEPQQFFGHGFVTFWVVGLLCTFLSTYLSRDNPMPVGTHGIRIIEKTFLLALQPPSPSSPLSPTSQQRVGWFRNRLSKDARGAVPISAAPPLHCCVVYLCHAVKPICPLPAPVRSAIVLLRVGSDRSDGSAVDKSACDQVLDA